MLSTVPPVSVQWRPLLRTLLLPRLGPEPSCEWRPSSVTEGCELIDFLFGLDCENRFSNVGVSIYSELQLHQLWNPPKRTTLWTRPMFDTLVHAERCSADVSSYLHCTCFLFRNRHLPEAKPMTIPRVGCLFALARCPKMINRFVFNGSVYWLGCRVCPFQDSFSNSEENPLSSVRVTRLNSLINVGYG